MKILQLELTGFGPFRRAQFVDFGSFDEEGLFLIGGKTGAGKSSILDAITFALYGKTARYEGAPRGVRSNFSSPEHETKVCLEFEHGRQRYRVTRSPEYEAAKKRGEGTTIRPADQKLEQFEDGQWLGIAKSARDVGVKLQEIFPLSATEFLQVVMLAQNEFQKFLHADSTERQSLLRKLFHTDRYNQIKDLLTERAKQSGAELERLTARVAELADSLESRRADLLPAQPVAHSETDVVSGFPYETDEDREDSDAASQTEVRIITEEWLDDIVALSERAHHDRETAQRECSRVSTEASKGLREALRVRQLQLRKSKAKAERDNLLADRERIQTEVATRIEADNRAAPLVPTVAVTQKAENTLLSARESLTAADERLRAELAAERASSRTAPFASDALSVDVVRAAARDLTERMGALREHKNIDADLSATRASLETAKNSAQQHDERIAAVRNRIDEGPELRAALVGQLSTVRERSQGRELAQTTLSEAMVRRKSAAELPKLEDAVTTAAKRLDQALTESTAKQENERTLNSRRWLGAASTLAQDLLPGEPCTVCGATEHPAPALSDAEHVTDAMLKAAEIETSEAAKGVEKARSKKDTAVSQADHTRTLADGLTLSAATEREEAACAALELIAVAESTIADLEGKLAKLHQESTTDAVKLKSLTEAHDEARALVTITENRVNELVTRQAQLRGEFTTVRDRLARTRTIESACQTYVSCAEALDRAEAEAAEARRLLDSVLHESRFANEAEVLAARLDKATRNALVSERETHEKHLHAAQQTLSEPELASLPAELVDDVKPTERDRIARESLDRANRALGVADSIRKEVHSTATTAKEALTALDAIGERAQAQKQLAADLSGKNERMQNLEAFVLAAHLEQILDAANARLSDITANRYELDLDDDLAGHGRQSGLGLKIFDVYNGKSRQPKSLSGGETFLVSLALALGLADVVSSQAGGITLDTLFIDEGFGSLDSDTLEIAMRTLDQLRQGGRTVGVISHVGSMHERIPAHLDVEVSADGSSDIRTDV